MELVYRRCSPAARRPEREVSALGFCLVNREAALGLVKARRMEQIQSSGGGSSRRRWICIQGLRSSGLVPGRWIYSVGFTSSTSTSIFYGSFKSFKAMGLRLIWGWRHPFWKTAGGGKRQRCPACKGPRVMVVFFSFFKGLCANCLGVQLSFVFFQNVPIRVHIFVRYFHG